MNSPMPLPSGAIAYWWISFAPFIYMGVCGPGMLEMNTLHILGANRSLVRILATPAMVAPGICWVRSVMIRALRPDLAAFVSFVVLRIASNRSNGPAILVHSLTVMAVILLPESSF